MKSRVHKLLKIINFAHLLGGVWLLSTATFLGIVLFKRNSDFFAGTYSTVLVLTVLTGLLAFCGSLILYLIYYLFLRKKERLGTPGSVRRGISPMVYVMAGIILALIGVFSVRGAYFLGQTSKSAEQQPVSETTPTPVQKVRYVESDPITTCTSSHSQCSGQSIQARKSECSNIYCCQVGDKWSVYPSESACAAAQPQKVENKTTSYPACTINYSQLGAITYYTIPPEECASKQIEARTNDVLTESYIKCVQNYGADNCER